MGGQRRRVTSSDVMRVVPARFLSVAPQAPSSPFPSFRIRASRLHHPRRQNVQRSDCFKRFLFITTFSVAQRDSEPLTTLSVLFPDHAARLPISVSQQAHCRSEAFGSWSARLPGPPSPDLPSLSTRIRFISHPSLTPSYLHLTGFFVITPSTDRHNTSRD